MALGMEMLVSTLIKAMGLNPEETIEQAKKFAIDIIGQVKQFDARLSQIEQDNAALRAQNAIFVAALKAQGLVKEILENTAHDAQTVETIDK